jgi:hypothetical protein
LLGAQSTAADSRSFNVQFAGCTEFVGWGPVSLAAAQPLVPAGYVIAGATNGEAAIVVRATSCEEVSVDQSVLVCQLRIKNRRQPGELEPPRERLIIRDIDHCVIIDVARPIRGYKIDADLGELRRLRRR